ncbi:hypothetical protein JCM6882_007973 [Rhodosporidiobolus microsporus]
MPTAIPAVPTPRLNAAGAAKLQATLDAFSKRIPGCFLYVGTGEEILFKGMAGKYDMLEEGDDTRKVDNETVFWFASTTKLIAALQLIERGLLSFDTPVSQFFDQVKPPFNIIRSVDPATKAPAFEECNVEITVKMLMTQTGGFGDEFGEKVRPWKAWTKVGKGFTNSCIKENLLAVPPTEIPGTTYQYGNCSEWLGLVIQSVTGLDLDDYFRANIFAPLGMEKTGFYPFDSPELAKDLMPLRWHNSAEMRKEKGEGEWVELQGQQDILKLPRDRSKIEYPVAGGGIYSRPSEYHSLLRHLLHSYLHSSGSSPLALSTSSIASLFTPQLPPGAHDGWAPYFRQKYKVSDPTHIDWSTGLSILTIPEGEQLGGYGRFSGAASWSGAPGIEYSMDPKGGIAWICGTNFLPMADEAVEELRTTLERMVYELVEFE